MDSLKKSNKHLFDRRAENARSFWTQTWDWLKGQTLLFEAFLVAISIHVLLLPVLWVAGWLLPFPKGPVITTVVEIDLRYWPLSAKQKSWTEYRDPKNNQ